MIQGVKKLQTKITWKTHFIITDADSTLTPSYLFVYIRMALIIRGFYKL